MAENKKFGTVLTNHPTDKAKKKSWKWRERFCREIGVPFLYGKVLSQIPVKDLSIMIGAVVERERYAGTIMLVMVQLIRELTVLPWLQRPRRGLRERWRRMRAFYMLAQVLYNMARECCGNTDEYVQRALGILHPQQEKADVGVTQPLPKDTKVSDLENKIKTLERLLNEQAATQRSLNEQLEVAKNVANRLEAMLQKQTSEQNTSATNVSIAEPNDKVQQAEVDPEDLPTVVVDGEALQRMCDEHYAGEIIVPVPVAREKLGNRGNYEAWAVQVSEKYGLSVKIGKVPAKELPELSVRRKDSGLSANAYLTVKYGLGVAAEVEPSLARVEFDDHAIKALYLQELDKLLAKRAKRA